jgi:hypothetical protein
VKGPRLLQDFADGIFEPHFKAVQNPCASEGDDDQPVETAPGQAVRVSIEYVDGNSKIQNALYFEAVSKRLPVK